MSSPNVFAPSNHTRPKDPTRPYRVPRNFEYPKQVWYFIAVFIFILATTHYGYKILTWRRVSCGRSALQRTRSKDAEGQAVRTRTSSVRNLGIGALNAFRVAAFRKSTPLFLSQRFCTAEVIIPLGYLTALLVWTFMNTRSNADGKWFDLRYWDNRSGTIAASQFPLVVALAGRNNIVSLLTGIGYEKLQPIHRGVARSVLVLVWIHMWGRFRAGLRGHNGFSYPVTPLGVACTVIMTVMALYFKPFRNAAYEIFYYTHVLFALAFLIMAYYHCEIAGRCGYYIWPCLVIWGFDRFVRFCKMIYINLDMSPATIELLSPDTLCITVSRRMRWAPGQSAYLTIPAISRFPLESHPFTISGIDQSLDVASHSERKDPKREVKLIIRARGGFTKRLCDYARRQPERTLWMFLNGPYGCPPDLRGKDTVILITGGSGVSYTLPLMMDLVRRSSQSKALCRRIVFIWCIREREHISWISEELNAIVRHKPPHLSVDIRIHITGTTPDLPIAEKDDEKNSDSKISSSAASLSEKDDVKSQASAVMVSERQGGITRLSGRPDIRTVLAEEISVASGSVSVDVSGPQCLSDVVVDALATKIGMTEGLDISLHVEKFGLA